MRGEPVLMRDGTISVARVHPNVAAGSASESGDVNQPMRHSTGP